jgi:hypothetical protein
MMRRDDDAASCCSWAKMFLSSVDVIVVPITQLISQLIAIFGPCGSHLSGLTYLRTASPFESAHHTLIEPVKDHRFEAVP